ncbi:MAG: 3-phosphoshikimate 1-carboxyvinyltransferase [Acidobacteriota bacterium]
MVSIFGSPDPSLASVLADASAPSFPTIYGPVSNGVAARGRLRPPGSKSMTQRYLSLALCAGRFLAIEQPLLSDDIRHFLGAFRAIGWSLGGSSERLELTPPAALQGGDERIDLFCGAGGTMLRFLTAVLTVVPGRFRLDGVPRLRERTVAPLIDAVRQLGGDVSSLEQPGFAPLDIRGRSLRGGRATLDAGASSQFLSALLLAATRADEPVEIEVAALTSEPYVDLTVEAVQAMGGRVTRERSFGGAAALYRVEPGLDPQSTVAVEADFSAVAYPAAAAALTGGEVQLDAVSPRSAQGDRRFVDLLEAMGATVSWPADGAREPLVVRGSRPLEAVEVDLGSMPDQVPTLAALAPFAQGVTRMRGVAHLRIKESDRLRAMATELRRAGAEAEELDDGLVVPGVWAETPPPTTPVVCESWDDHRIAMSMALVGTRRPGLSIRQPEVVAKSYPWFWRDLEQLVGAPPPS